MLKVYMQIRLPCEYGNSNEYIIVEEKNRKSGGNMLRQLC